ncbi:hypothetical protein V498_01182 [Pseudogymnoascus sp. VKM F-4517 (FW-2822)]|nr:hypothetical protein V498_01182 [Pseudogymnoascus sp. VKM F-4517 (FW-2822)]
MQSLRPSERSPLLDISTLSPEFISDFWSVCPGYLDTALSVFERHGQPFILVSTLAMIWSGARNAPRKEIDVLVRSTHLQTLIDGLVETTDWEISEFYGDDASNETHIPDVWLKATFPDPQFEYIRLWPEELYHLSIDCHKIEVSDVYIRDTVLLEEEYHRDPCQRFGPRLLRYFEERSLHLLLPIQARAKIMRRDIPIFIPTIEDHLNALLDQRREQIRTDLDNGGAPEWQIRNFIRYLFLDWKPARDWILSTKVRRGSCELSVYDLQLAN